MVQGLKHSRSASLEETIEEDEPVPKRPCFRPNSCSEVLFDPVQNRAGIQELRAHLPPARTKLLTFNKSRDLYRYSPLPTMTSIRLIELFPGNGKIYPSDRKLDPNQSPIDEVCFTLHTMELSDAPRYDAISYTWGSSHLNVESRCEGKILRLRPHLHDALVKLRQRSRSLFLWADAICIDQSNIQERGHQVGIMRQIYQKSDRVLVWLGRDNLGQAAKAAEAIWTISSVATDKQLANADDLYPFTYVEPSNLPTLIEPSWPALQWMLSRPWFSRLWVFQEVTANKNVLVICGDVVLKWDHVALAATYLQAYPLYFPEFSASYAYNAYCMRNRDTQSRWSLLGAFCVARNFLTTDRRDLLYAMLGFPAFDAAKDRITPDYNKTIAEVFTEIVHLTLAESQNLDILSCVYHPTNRALDDEKFPSWVPKWSHIPNMIADTAVAHVAGANTGRNALGRYRGVLISHGRWTNRYNYNKLVCEVRGNSLTLHGFTFSSVSALVTSKDTSGWFTKDTQSSDWEHQYSIGNHPLNTSSFHPWGSPKHPVEQLPLALALTAGLLFDGRSAKDDMATFEADLAAYTDSTFSRKDIDQESADRFRFSAERMSRNRIIFRTGNGYLGLGPQIAVPGDVICILRGAHVPYILRPVSSYYRLIGECFVHGIMEGEAVHQWECRDTRDETFEIQ